MKKRILQIALPLLILGAAGAIFSYFLKNKPEPFQRKRPFLGAVVEVVELKASNRQIHIQTHGKVEAKERITLTSRITGVVEKVSPKLLEGSFFKKNELLIIIRPTTNVSPFYTDLRAPFNGVIQKKNISIGQFVNPGFNIATLISSDHAYVKIDLPLREVAWLPSEQKTNAYNISATIKLAYGNRVQTWEGQLKRNLLELSPKGLMAQITIEVPDPFRLNSNSDFTQSLPLYIGSFVDVSIPAHTFKDAYIIPAHAVHDQNSVWLASADGTLEIRSVEVAYLDKQEAIITKGLTEGESLIISPLRGASSGLKIRVLGQENPNRGRKDGRHVEFSKKNDSTDAEGGRKREGLHDGKALEGDQVTANVKRELGQTRGKQNRSDVPDPERRKQLKKRCEELPESKERSNDPRTKRFRQQCAQLNK